MWELLCARRSCADMMGVADGAKSGTRADESEDERRARHQAEAAGLFRSVLAEATGDQVSSLRLCLSAVPCWPCCASSSEGPLFTSVSAAACWALPPVSCITGFCSTPLSLLHVIVPGLGGKDSCRMLHRLCRESMVLLHVGCSSFWLAEIGHRVTRARA